MDTNQYQVLEDIGLVMLISVVFFHNYTLKAKQTGLMCTM